MDESEEILIKARIGGVEPNCVILIIGNTEVYIDQADLEMALVSKTDPKFKFVRVG